MPNSKLEWILVYSMLRDFFSDDRRWLGICYVVLGAGFLAIAVIMLSYGSLSEFASAVLQSWYLAALSAWLFVNVAVSFWLAGSLLVGRQLSRPMFLGGALLVLLDTPPIVAQGVAYVRHGVAQVPGTSIVFLFHVFLLLCLVRIARGKLSIMGMERTLKGGTAHARR
jgi:hypothetical protein